MAATAEPITATKPVRVKADLAEMLSGISWYETKFSIPDFLDGIIRDAVAERFAALPEGVRATVAERIAALT